jgi:IclR family transcriptional regulator, mhp operon transcriptional activator
MLALHAFVGWRAGLSVPRGIASKYGARSAKRNIEFRKAEWHDGAMAKRTQRADTIQGLQRGLQVMRILQESPIASLTELHAATRISKPSLLRILKTLEQAGMVSRRLADGHYRLSSFAPAGRKRDAYDLVAEAAAPVLHRLCQIVKWPSDLVVPAGNYLERRETTRPHSPLVINPAVIQLKVNWLMTALGRVYLAYCPARERERVLARLRKSDEPVDRLARDPKRLEQILAETRTRGFGVRDPGFVGGPYGSPPFDDGLAGMAVALRDGKRVYGVINILWIRTAFTIEQMASMHLRDLQAAADEIVAAVRAARKASDLSRPVRAR